MLVEFRVKNFLSFKDEAVFDMKAGKGRGFGERVYLNKNTKILKFASLFGANGSGKSNFTKAISFSRNYIVHGINRAALLDYFKLDLDCKNTPTKFEYKICINDKIYKYGFELILSTNSVLKEWLIDVSTQKEKIILFRDVVDEYYIVDEYFKDSNLSNKLDVYADGIKSENNSLFLSTINKYKNIFNDHEEARILRSIYNWFCNKLKVKYPDSQINDYAYFMSQKNMNDVISFFNDFDLSITNYKFVECSLEKIALDLPKEIFEEVINDITNVLSNNDVEDGTLMFGLNDELFTARLENEQVMCKTIQFYHDNKDVAFSMSEEADGTKKIFKLMEILFQEDDDTIYIVDEIDRCLHSLLTYNFVDAFLEKAKNRNCQLIVTTHESLLLDFKLLRKDEVWLVCKENGESKLLPLGNTPIRADTKMIKSYLLGKTAIPKIKNDKYKINNMTE